MSVPIFNQSGLLVAARTDLFKGPRLQFHSSTGELTQSEVGQLVKTLQAYLDEMRRLKVCLECNNPENDHLWGCRQRGFSWTIEPKVRSSPRGPTLPRSVAGTRREGE